MKNPSKYLLSYHICNMRLLIWSGVVLPCKIFTPRHRKRQPSQSRDELLLEGFWSQKFDILVLGGWFGMSIGVGLGVPKYMKVVRLSCTWKFRNLEDCKLVSFCSQLQLKFIERLKKKPPKYIFIYLVKNKY